MRLTPFPFVVAFATLLLGSAAARAQAQTPTTAAPALETPSRLEAVVAVSKSQVVEVPTTYGDLVIADPKIADVLPLTARSFYIEGRSLGTTELSVYDSGKHLIAAIDVVVSPDLEGLKTRLNQILPGEKDIAVRSANQSIVLSGTVSSPSVLQQALSLAEAYAPTHVINMLGVEGTQQVMLSVRFVEMERTAAKNLRVNAGYSSAPGGNQFGLFTGDNNNAPLGSVIDTFGKMAMKLNGNLNLYLDALESKGLIKTLAEPNLVAMSGDTANFLAGGEFPIPVAQSANGVGAAPTITIEYKQFGVALAFTPTILSDGMINLVVNPEVSSIDPTITVNLGSIIVPGLKVRRGHTTVELRDGESFTIAGLLQNDYQSNIRQFPFAGDLPIIGPLMRSNGFKRDETELVVVITPHLVTARRGPMATPVDHFTPPSDYELFMLGQMQSRKSGARPEDQVLTPTDPTKGGVDGPHGHVLY